MKCDFSESLICPRCGYRAQHANTFRNCSPPTRGPFMVGDAVEKVLTSIGVTPERVEQLIGKPCGCPGRKKWLNDAGVAVQEFGAKVVDSAARFYGMK